MVGTDPACTARRGTVYGIAYPSALHPILMLFESQYHNVINTECITISHYNKSGTYLEYMEYGGYHNMLNMEAYSIYWM